MLARALADATLVLHLAFIGFALFGGLLWLRLRLAPLVHLPACAWAAWVELAGRGCPLTPLENTLRRAAGEAGYTGGFVEHYLVPLVYPAALTRDDQLGLGAAVLLLNALLYATVWHARRRRGRRTPARRREP